MILFCSSNLEVCVEDMVEFTNERLLLISLTNPIQFMCVEFIFVLICKDEQET